MRSAVPFQFVAGLHGVSNFRMALPSNYTDEFAGQLINDDITYQSEHVSTLEEANIELDKFIDLAWREAGVPRPIRRER